MTSTGERHPRYVEEMLFVEAAGHRTPAALTRPAQGEPRGALVLVPGSLFLDVDDENTAATESANPVETLRMRYDAWRAAGGLEGLGLAG